MLKTYYPEMKEAKPEADFTAKMSHYGSHYFVESVKEIKGRGVTFLGVNKPEDFIKPNNPRVGQRKYRLTSAAFDLLVKASDVSMETLL